VSRNSSDLDRETTAHGVGRTGRPPLTERRRAQTRLEIAREAVRLFTVRGVAATSAEEIAAAVGVSARTLWRYFPSKESCVLPLLAGGIEMFVHSLRAWGPGQPVTTLLDDLESVGADLLDDVPTLLALVRLTRIEQGLRLVWLQTHDDAESAFAAVLAARAGRPADDLTIKVQATMINNALRVAVEDYAFHADPADADTAALLAAIRTALLVATQGLHP
jgi:AcrR family transcriptional regulator